MRGKIEEGKKFIKKSKQRIKRLVIILIALMMILIILILILISLIVLSMLFKCDMLEIFNDDSTNSTEINQNQWFQQFDITKEIQECSCNDVHIVIDLEMKIIIKMLRFLMKISCSEYCCVCHVRLLEMINFNQIIL